MASLKIYAVRDAKVGEHLPPFFARSHGEAERIFENSVRQQDLFRDYPSDFSLWFVGVFHPESGVIVPETQPVFVMEAVTVSPLDPSAALGGPLIPEDGSTGMPIKTQAE